MNYNAKLTQATKDALIGRSIHDVADKCLILDNGLRIYLDAEEIEALNAANDEELD